jgi:hypothetical protein
MESSRSRWRDSPVRGRGLDRFASPGRGLLDSVNDCALLVAPLGHDATSWDLNFISEVVVSLFELKICASLPDKAENDPAPVCPLQQR